MISDFVGMNYSNWNLKSSINPSDFATLALTLSLCLEASLRMLEFYVLTSMEAILQLNPTTSSVDWIYTLSEFVRVFDSLSKTADPPETSVALAIEVVVAKLVDVTSDRENAEIGKLFGTIQCDICCRFIKSLPSLLSMRRTAALGHDKDFVAISRTTKRATDLATAA